MEKEFRIKLVTKRSHWLKEFALGLFVASFIALLIFYVSMTPSKNSSLELQVLWFIGGVPLWVKRLVLWGIVFLGFAIIFEIINQRSKSGFLNIKENSIEIFTKIKSLRFLFDEIKEIAFVSPFGSNKYKIFFKLKGDKTITIKLSDYSMVDEFTSSLSPHLNREVKVITDISDPYWLE
ncbi:MAG: hypothetical protein JST17_08860 [Bacteroidetes bacterium]|nr:hypothetical protein [Bacteroidota bacterium]MBS1932155.1 hypothetical protein [Bacteroidota bacterium]